MPVPFCAKASRVRIQWRQIVVSEREGTYDRQVRLGRIDGSPSLIKTNWWPWANLGLLALAGTIGHSIFVGNFSEHNLFLGLAALLSCLTAAGLDRREWVDIEARVHIRSWRWWFRRRTRQRQLSSRCVVELRQQSRRRPRLAGRDQFHVSLTDERRVTPLYHTRDEGLAHRQAELISQALDLPLRDLRGPAAKSRRARHLNCSVIELASADEFRSVRPGASRVSVIDDARGRRILIRPAASIKPELTLIACLIGFCMALHAWLSDAGGASPTQAWVAYAWMALTGLVVAVAYTTARARGWTARQIRVTRAGLRLGWRSMSLTAVEAISIMDDGNTPRHLLIESEQSVWRVGRGLRMEELAYLRSSLMRALRTIDQPAPARPSEKVDSSSAL